MDDPLRVVRDSRPSLAFDQPLRQRAVQTALQARLICPLPVRQLLLRRQRPRGGSEGAVGCVVGQADGGRLFQCSCSVFDDAADNGKLIVGSKKTLPDKADADWYAGARLCSLAPQRSSWSALSRQQLVDLGLPDARAPLASASETY